MTKFKWLLTFLFPTGYLSYLLWIRLSIKYPKVFANFSLLRIFVMAVTIICYILKIRRILQQLNILSYKEAKNPILVNVIRTLNVIYDFIEKTWKEWFKIVFCNEVVKLPFALFLLSFLKHMHNKHKKYIFNVSPTCWIFIFLDLLPRIVVSLFLIVDVFCFERLYYFFYGLILLLLPGILNGFLNIIMHFHETNMDQLHRAIEIWTTDEGRTFTRFTEGIEVPWFVDDINDFIENHFRPMYNIPNLIKYITRLRNNKKTLFVELFIAVTYLISWLTILVKWFLLF